MSSALASSSLGVNLNGEGVKGGGMRRAFAEKLQLSKQIRERKTTADQVQQASDFEFFRRLVLDTDWDETLLREKLLNAIGGGKNINDKNPKGGATVLHMACSKASSIVVNTLLRCKADPHIKTDQKRTALHYAASNRDPKVAAIVLSFCDNALKRQLQRDSLGLTPFEVACSIGNGATAKFLFDRFPRTHLSKLPRFDKLKRTVLHLLVSGFPHETQLSMINELIELVMKERPQDVWARDIDLQTPLAVHVKQHYKSDSTATFGAIIAKLSPEEVDKAIYMIFNQKAARSTEWKPEKWLCLQRLMTSGETCKYLPPALFFSSKESILAKDQSGRSILHWLALFGFQPSIIEEVSQFKDDDDDEEEDHLKTELHIDSGVRLPVPSNAQVWLSRLSNVCWDSLRSRADVADLLFAPIESQQARAKQGLDFLHDTNGDTPLHIAAKYNNEFALRHLTDMFGREECKKIVNAKGWSPLHLAAKFNAFKAIIELKDQGWDLDAKTPDGYTPYMLAMKGKQMVTSQVLKSYGATSTGIVADDGTSIESLVEAHTKLVSDYEKRREARRLAIEKEDEEEEDEAGSSGTAEQKEPSETGSTGSVEYRPDAVASDEEDEEEEESESDTDKEIIVAKQPMIIKADSEYDEEVLENGNGTAEGHGKPHKRFGSAGNNVNSGSGLHTRKSSGNGSITSVVSGGATRKKPRLLKISKDDEYDKSSSSEEEFEDEEGYNSFEEKSEGSDTQSPASSPAVSPREHTEEQVSPRRVPSPMPQLPTSPRRAAAGTDSTSPRSPHSTDSVNSTHSISSNEEELSILRQRNEELEAKLRDVVIKLSASTSSSASTIAELSDSMQKLKDDGKKSEAKLKELGSLVQEKDSLLKEKDATIKENELHIIQIDQELTKLKSENSFLSASSAVTAASTASPLSQDSQLLDELASSKAKEQIEAVRSELELKIRNLQRQVTEQQQQNSTLSSENKQYMADLQDSTSRNLHIESEAKNKEAKLEAQIALLTSQLRSSATSASTVTSKPDVLPTLPPAASNPSIMIQDLVEFSSASSRIKQTLSSSARLTDVLIKKSDYPLLNPTSARGPKAKTRSLGSEVSGLIQMSLLFIALMMLLLLFSMLRSRDSETGFRVS